jgi:Mg2+ and Co2+ transporter CorA
MITYYYKSLRSKEIQQLETYKRGAWVNVESPTHQEIEQLVKEFGPPTKHIAH